MTGSQVYRESASSNLADLVRHIVACRLGLSLHDSTRALQESLTLFDAVSTRTAVALGIEPFDAGRVRQRVESVLGTTLCG
jgi:hypothetical protein